MSNLKDLLKDADNAKKMQDKALEFTQTQKAALEKSKEMDALQKNFPNAETIKVLGKATQEAAVKATIGAAQTFAKAHLNIIDHFAASLVPSLTSQNEIAASLSHQIHEAGRLAAERIGETISQDKTLQVDYSVFKPKLPEYTKIEPRNLAQETIDLYQQKAKSLKTLYLLTKVFALMW